MARGDEQGRRRRSGDQAPGRGVRFRIGPFTGRLSDVTPLDIDALLDDHSVHIVVCCGSGGVGKTTTSAALGVRAAERGRRVVVLTIDPARRLAQSLGLEQLDNTPRPVRGVDTSTGGGLDAMMLDMKRTFDEVVEAHASPDKAEQIFANPFYQALSSSFAGTQEYMAMEKLSQLRTHLSGEPGRDGRWDLIVVDTPPSRSALDFLDAPERLSSFLDGRLIRILLAPARGPARVFTAGISVVTGVLSKILGGQMLRDVQTFVSAFDALFGGFRARAEQTYQVLKAPQTAFVVVASPDIDALREAAFFVERLEAEGMPLAGLVLNRVTDGATGGISAQAALAGAERLDDERLTAALLRLHARRLERAARERAVRRRFAGAHPGVRTATIPALPTDVHDLEALREIGDLLIA